jgi:hypothetical protein
MHSRATSVFLNLVFYCSSTANRPRSRWDDDNEMDLGEMEYADVKYIELVYFQGSLCTHNTLSMDFCARISFRSKLENISTSATIKLQQNDTRY